MESANKRLYYSIVAWEKSCLPAIDNNNKKTKQNVELRRIDDKIMYALKKRWINITTGFTYKCIVAGMALT